MILGIELTQPYPLPRPQQNPAFCSKYRRIVHREEEPLPNRYLPRRQRLSLGFGQCEAGFESVEDGRLWFIWFLRVVWVRMGW